MLSTQEYLLSWGLYLLGALGLMVVWWRMTGWLRPPALRNVLRISAAVALVMPYPVPGQEAFLAPALMMTFLEGLFFEEYGFSHAGIPLILAVVIANIVYLLADLVWQLYRRKHGAASADDNSRGGEQGDSSAADQQNSREKDSVQERKTPTISS